MITVACLSSSVLLDGVEANAKDCAYAGGVDGDMLSNGKKWEGIEAREVEGEHFNSRSNMQSKTHTAHSSLSFVALTISYHAMATLAVAFAYKSVCHMMVSERRSEGPSHLCSETRSDWVSASFLF